MYTGNRKGQIKWLQRFCQKMFVFLLLLSYVDPQNPSSFLLNDIYWAAETYTAATGCRNKTLTSHQVFTGYTHQSLTYSHLEAIFTNNVHIFDLWQEAGLPGENPTQTCGEHCLKINCMWL